MLGPRQGPTGTSSYPRYNTSPAIQPTVKNRERDALYTDSLAYKSIEVTLLLLMDCSWARKQAGKASQLVHQSTARQRDVWAGVVCRATAGLPVQECGSPVPI